MPYTDNPAANPIDRVRFLIGDKSTTNPDLSDSEIAYLLSVEGNEPLRAAARAAETLSAKYAKDPSEKKVGPLTIMHGTRAVTRSMEYARLAKALWNQVASKSVAPFAGGISVADKNSRRQDSDRVQPAFARDMMEYPQGTPNSSTPEEILGGG